MIPDAADYTEDASCPDGVSKNEADCFGFHSCVGGLKWEMKCPANLSITQSSLSHAFNLKFKCSTHWKMFATTRPTFVRKTRRRILLAALSLLSFISINHFVFFYAIWWSLFDFALSQWTSKCQSKAYWSLPCIDIEKNFLIISGKTPLEQTKWVQLIIWQFPLIFIKIIF